MTAQQAGPKAAIFRALILVAIVVLGTALVRFTPLAELMTKENMVALFQQLRDAWWAPLLLIGLYVVATCIVVPVSPLMLGGGVVFGFVAGSFYNMVGLLAGMFASYYLALFLGRDFIVQVTGDKLRRAERIFERSGFWPLVQVRFMPIPFAIVNYGAALAGVSAPLFLATSTLGLIPATLINTFYVSAVFEAPLKRYPFLILEYLLVLGAFNVAISYPSIRRLWRRRKRYRELMQARQARQTSRAQNFSNHVGGDFE